MATELSSRLASPGSGNTNTLRTLLTVHLDKPPCCLDVHPFHHDVFAVGAYDLVESDPSGNGTKVTQERNGSVTLFQVVGNAVQQLCTLQTSFGILDLHWQPRVKGRLGAATSTGSIALYSCAGLEERRDATNLTSDLRLAHLVTLQLCAGTDLITAFSWIPSSIDRIAYTISTGEVRVFSDVPGAAVAHEGPSTVDCRDNSQRLFTHSLEAWTLSYHRTKTDVDGVISGGDDAVIQWTPLADPAPAHPHWANRKLHTAGVTAILPLYKDFIATGSYDDRFRIMQLPAAGSSRLEAVVELNLGGGVWRLIHAGSNRRPGEQDVFGCRLLVCCMYAGACVLEVELGQDGRWRTGIIAKFTEHESMCYGGGILRGPRDAAGEGGRIQAVAVKEQSDGGARVDETFLTCSFYDKRLCLWTIRDQI